MKHYIPLFDLIVIASVLIVFVELTVIIDQKLLVEGYSLSLHHLIIVEELHF